MGVEHPLDLSEWFGHDEALALDDPQDAPDTA
jgi:hypothetical protein